MNIGIDLDGVVYNSENWLMAYAEINDIKNKGRGVQDPLTNDIKRRYGMSEKEAQEFRLKVIPLQISLSPLMPFARECLEFLKSLGHKIIFITSRGGVSLEHIHLTKKRLKEDNISYDNICFAIDKSKLEYCLENKIDIMIDDTSSILNNLSRNNVRCLQFINGNVEKNVDERVKKVYNWGDVVREIVDIERRKNEIQF